MKYRMPSILTISTLTVILLITKNINAADCLTGIEYNVDLKQSSVSGISSGAYMAQQFHTANSAWMVGAGIFSGGPYFCAENSVANGAGRCVNGGISQADLQRFLDEANNQASAGRIDAVANLADDRVWLFHGIHDEGVNSQVVDSLKSWYELAGVPATNIYYSNDFAAGHTWPSKYYIYPEGNGNLCAAPSDYPWIGACDWDAAGDMLQHIYGPDPLNARNNGELKGEIIGIDQSSCFNAGGYGKPVSMNPEAYIYVPESCANGAECKLHVAFHGCEMNYESAPSPFAGDSGPRYELKFVKNSGLNAWADTNNIIVLYPQVKKYPGLIGFTNPKGCWDFWNYEGGGLPHTKHGRQVDVVRAMMMKIAAIQPSTCLTATNDDHVSAGRAYKKSFLVIFKSYFAEGSNDELGTNGNAVTSLEKTSEGYWRKVDSCAGDS